MPLFGQCTFLGNFAHVEGKKIAAYTNVNWKINCIISKVVDSTTNAVAGNDDIKLITNDDRPIDVYVIKCMPHKGSTTALTASQTSDHVGTLKSDEGEILTKCHRLT